MSKIKDFFGDGITYSSSEYLTGSVLMIPFLPANMTTEMPGFLLCDGAGLSITGVYEPLFDVIGYKYGGSSGSWFRLPDYRGLFMRGRDMGGGHDPEIGGRTGLWEGTASGSDIGSYQDQQIKSHIHRWKIDTGNGTYSAFDDLNPTLPPGSNGSSTAYTSYVGGVETRPKNYAMVFVIKY